jgi:hypothetical protein
LTSRHRLPRRLAEKILDGSSADMRRQAEGNSGGSTRDHDTGDLLLFPLAVVSPANSRSALAAGTSIDLPCVRFAYLNSETTEVGVIPSILLAAPWISRMSHTFLHPLLKHSRCSSAEQHRVALAPQSSVQAQRRNRCGDLV